MGLFTLLEKFGGSIRFIYGTFIRKFGLTNRPKYTLREYLNVPDNEDLEFYESVGHALINRAVGLFQSLLFSG